MRKFASSLGVFLMAFFLTTGISAAQGQYISGSVGVDMSWPNCSTNVGKTSFGIVGVTNGTPYSANSCLASEAANFTNLSFYVNTGWNDQSSFVNANSPKTCAANDGACLAYNYGYNAGLDAYNTAASAGVTSYTWWLDVENVNTWNGDTNQNRASIQGEYDALMDKGATTVGIYSTTAQWNSITGSWLNYWPSWGATTWTTAKQAQKYCHGHEFTGGPSYLMQFTPKKQPLDQNVAC